MIFLLLYRFLFLLLSNFFQTIIEEIIKLFWDSKKNKFEILMVVSISKFLGKICAFGLANYVVLKLFKEIGKIINKILLELYIESFLKTIVDVPTKNKLASFSLCVSSVMNKMFSFLKFLKQRAKILVHTLQNW